MGLVIDCHRISASDAKIKKFTCLITVFFLGGTGPKEFTALFYSLQNWRVSPRLFPFNLSIK